MRQSRLMSLVEAVANVAIGYAIGGVFTGVSLAHGGVRRRADGWSAGVAKADAVRLVHGSFASRQDRKLNQRSG
jgi:hypothetical protein